MIVLAIVLSAAAWLRLGWRISLGFACGCAIAFLNFHWLKRVVSGLAGPESPRSRPTAVGKGNCGAFPAALFFDGAGGLCYIHCFRAPASMGCLRAYLLP